MVATVLIVEKNGAPGTNTDKTSGSIRMKNADDATVDLNNPLTIVAATTDYSYEKWLRLKITVAPSGQITNLKFYTDGSSGYGTGVNLWAKAVTAYATPAEGTSTVGYTTAFSYVSTAALTLSTATHTATGEIGDHLVLLMTVADTATQGVKTAETITFTFDEI